MTGSGRRPTILVVEDEPQIMDIVTLLLKDNGYEVLQAANGRMALSMVQQVKPDLIISDVRMPGMDGFTLCEHIRADVACARIPFVFLTAYGEKADVRRGMGLGADDYLTKPFEPEDLLSAVDVRLSRAAETQAAIAKAGATLQDRIIRTLTHEFRTPLALVAGYTELLESNGKEMNEDEFQATMQGLYSGSRRLTNLVEDFLLLSRLHTGALAREIASRPSAPISPEPVVRSVINQAREEAAARNVTLRVECQAGDLLVGLCRDHLVEIARRLVDNACKFSKSQGGQVWVTSRAEGNWWLLTVADEGIGIHPQALSWIFEAFQQVDRARMEQQGSGIGLTIVRELVHIYGGQVGVKSKVGQGSTFEVRIPVIPAWSSQLSNRAQGPMPFE